MPVRTGNMSPLVAQVHETLLVVDAADLNQDIAELRSALTFAKLVFLP